MRAVVTLAIVLVVVSTAAGGQPAPDAEPDKGLWNEILRLYEKAKEAGEEAPKDVYEWLTQEVQGFGDWEYRVVEMKEASPAELEARLNELGAERWECIWIETMGRKKRYTFKRPVKGYLGQIPLSDLIKLIPYPVSGEN